MILAEERMLAIPFADFVGDCPLGCVGVSRGLGGAEMVTHGSLVQ